MWNKIDEHIIARRQSGSYLQNRLREDTLLYMIQNLAATPQPKYLRLPYVIFGPTCSCFGNSIHPFSETNR
jgi:hypothetical protein